MRERIVHLALRERPLSQESIDRSATDQRLHATALRGNCIVILGITNREAD